MLRPFTGVLVSDFYAAYDALECSQQKCLVHFVRDIDDDLLKNPLDEELKTMAQEFSVLLRQIVESVDRFGLKKRHLRKHRKPVNKFLSSIQSREFSSPVANGYKQRFDKAGAKMFTFLDHDGVPWNNNYAEHAIKRFAKYRRVFDGLYTEDSLTEYLILASVLNTCELNNINALSFLLSEERSLNGLRNLAQTNSRTKQSRVPNAALSELQQTEWAEAPAASPQNQPIIHISCMESDWKERCRDHLKARQEIELSDFEADADRNWCHQQAARQGGKCTVRKRSRHATFTFAQSI